MLIKFNEKEEYTPILRVPRVNMPISAVKPEDMCDVIPVIQEYVNDAPLLEKLNLGLGAFITKTQDDIAKGFIEPSTKLCQNGGIKFLVSQFAIFQITDTLIKPILIATIPRESVKYLKMATLAEVEFPSELVQIWSSEDYSISKDFYGKLRKSLYEAFKYDKTEVISMSSATMFNKIFTVFKKPVFLTREQEEVWLQTLWNEFREKK